MGTIAFTSLFGQVLHAEQPNIIIILADDMGYADVGFNAYDPRVHTPNIDRLANEGMLFKTSYTTGNICAPSRMGLLSGVYQNRYKWLNGSPIGKGGIPNHRDVFVQDENGDWVPDHTGELDDDKLPVVNQTEAPTMAMRLKNMGYRTFMAGKWHLGEVGEDGALNELRTPEQHGFEEAHYFDAGGKAPFFIHDDNYNPGNTGKDYYLWEVSPETNGNRKMAEVPTRNNYNFDDHYTTNYWTTKALNFINRNSDQPYFIYLSHNAVHSDIHDPESENNENNLGDREMVLKMGTMMDAQIGRLIEEVQRRNDNTLVFFLSDNGGATKGDVDDPQQSDNRPLRYEKHYDYEGGIRTPLIAWWPGKISTSQYDANPVISLDLLPTMLSAAGATNPTEGLDGLNLLDVMTGKTSHLAERSLFWSGGSDAKIGKAYQTGSEAQAALRRHDGKKLYIAAGQLSIFDMNEDEEERIDLLENVYDHSGGADFSVLDSDTKALLIDLFGEYTEEFLQQFPKWGSHQNPWGVGKKPVMKNPWEGGLFFIDERGIGINDFKDLHAGNAHDVIQQATTVKLEAGESQQLHIRSIWVRDGATPTFEHWQSSKRKDPNYTWSLISNIGGSINQNGVVTAGDQEGYMIAVVQEDEVRDISREENTAGRPIAYQLVRVGARKNWIPEQTSIISVNTDEAFDVTVPGNGDMDRIIVLYGGIRFLWKIQDGNQGQHALRVDFDHAGEYSIKTKSRTDLDGIVASTDTLVQILDDATGVTDPNTYSINEKFDVEFGGSDLDQLVLKIDDATFKWRTTPNGNGNYILSIDFNKATEYEIVVRTRASTGDYPHTEEMNVVVLE